jgi:hypothetical protein
MLLADDYSFHLVPNGSGVALMMMINTTNSVDHAEVDEAHKTVNFCSELTNGHPVSITMTKSYKERVCKSQKKDIINLLRTKNVPRGLSIQGNIHLQMHTSLPTPVFVMGSARPQ